jgi:uncharacterized protein YbjT (DUF2867 family)
MNLFVTGGTGYLGSAVTAALLADGRKVRADVRSIASAGRLPAGVEPVAGDLGDAAWLRARIDESHGVVHAASTNDATSGSFDAAFSAASRSRGLNGRIAAEPEADSRARLGLFLDSLPHDVITVVNTALPSIQGEES